MLIVTLLCATGLTAMGVLTKTELLPILGGIVVVAHRMLDGLMTRAQRDSVRPSRPPPTPPPTTGAVALLGMAAGSAASWAWAL